MNALLKQINFQIISFAIVVGLILIYSFDWSSKETKTTKILLSQWAEKLDRNVTPSGVYIKWESDTLPVNDAWGTPLKVYYKNEGIAEVLLVESAGKDMAWMTKDDLSVSKMQINAKGIGEGIKNHTAAVAKEATKGVFEGIKEETVKTYNSTKERAKKKTNSVKEKAVGLISNVKNNLSSNEERSE